MNKHSIHTLPFTESHFPGGSFPFIYAFFYTPFSIVFSPLICYT